MTTPAADLIEQAQAATTTEELDAIQAQADGRVTVLDAVEQRRAELAAEQGPTEPAAEPTATETESPTGGGGEGLPTPFGTPGEAAPGTDNPGDIEDPHGTYTAEQVDPPLGPYPDPPLGPYPDPVIKSDAPEGGEVAGEATSPPAEEPAP